LERAKKIYRGGELLERTKETERRGNKKTRKTKKGGRRGTRPKRKEIGGGQKSNLNVCRWGFGEKN